MRTHQKFLLLVLPVLGFAGCEAMRTGVPAVTPEMAREALENGDSIETLAAGRRLLAMRCTNCHAPAPVAKYTPAEWQRHVFRMADRAGLDEVQTKQVAAYLVAARESRE